MGGTTDRLIARTDRILRLWEDRIREELPAARMLSSPNLINTFPIFLQRIAEALAGDHPRRSAGEGSNVAEEHGSYRLRASPYRLEDLVREYQLLRDVLLEVLEEHGALGDDERGVISAAIDTGIREAVAAFVLLETRGRYREVSALVHDLRTPLTGARTAAELLARRSTDPEVTQWAVRIVDNLRRSEEMVQLLLDAQILQAGARVPIALAHFELSAFVDEVIAATAHARRVRVDARDRVEGWWSKDALRRIVENLVDNAVKFARADSTITLTVRADHGRMMLHVHNEGSYLPPEQRATLFQLFGRAGSAARGKSGWGLGLAIVRTLAESMGGSIVIESAPGMGTTFTVDLPLDAREYEHVIPSLPPSVAAEE